MAFQQPPLPYAINALAPYLGEEQMTYHYGKHHAAYFTNLNKLVENKPEEKMSLEEIIKTASGPLFNNAGQAWNHTFYWECMRPANAGGGGEPTGALKAALERDCGSVAAFKEAFAKTAVGVFGSGWAWLACDKAGKLELMGLSNADTPLKHGKTALLTCDVWEHAYYIDYRNLRPKFVDGFWTVTNWAFASKCYDART